VQAFCTSAPHRAVVPRNSMALLSCFTLHIPTDWCTARLSRICEGPSVFGLPGYQGYWTSGQRTNSSSCASPWVWKTYAGFYRRVSYTSWAPRQPDCLGGSETCLQLTTINYLRQRWADINCDWVLCPLCELDIP